MDSALETSPYLDWYVVVDPGHLSVQPSPITGKSLLWFTPKYGFDGGHPLCIAGGTPEELRGLKTKLDERKAEFQKTDKFQKYLQIEKWFSTGEGQIDPLKSSMSEYQRERLSRKKK